MTREQAWDWLRELYDQLPKVQCKGLCHDSCTSTDATELEREAIRERGFELPPGIRHHKMLELIAVGQTPRCSMLTSLNTCRIYDVRPLICRIFGTIRTAACEHGCMSDGWLEQHEVTHILMQVEVLSAQATGVMWARGERREVTPAEVERARVRAEETAARLGWWRSA